MNYIYDIVLNFNKNFLYEYYEWKEEDNPEFILKIPIYKIDEETYLNIKNNNIIINKNFLNQIQEKTETYTPNTISIIRYACVFSCEKEAFAIEFDSDGNSYMKSKLSLDEETEILEMTKNFKYSIIEYKIKNKVKKSINYATRKEQEQEKILLQKMEKIMKNGEYSKLKYIFYELYNEKLEDIEKVYNKIINLIKNNNNKIEDLCEIMNLIENKKIMSSKS